jgi:hypothetical protein
VVDHKRQEAKEEMHHYRRGPRTETNQRRQQIAAKVSGRSMRGSSVVKNASPKEQIDIQGDVQEVIPELISVWCLVR